MKLKGKHVLITGAAKRLGRAIAERCLKEGANVSAHYHQSEEEAQAFHASVKGLKIYKANLMNLDEIKSLATRVMKNSGPVDVLVNSASLFYPKNALDSEGADWEAFLNANTRAPFFLSQHIAKAMPAGSVIINLCDTHALSPVKNYAPYLISKGALWTMTKVLAKEWAPRIRVNSISPGVVLPPESYDAPKIASVSQLSWMKRIGSSEDIVQAFLCLIENDYMTGVDLRVDGGE